MEWLDFNSGLSGSDPEFCKWKSRVVCISLEQSKKENADMERLRKYLSWIRLSTYGKTPRNVLVNLLLAILRAPSPLEVRL
jgi:hypothetical protein